MDAASIRVNATTLKSHAGRVVRLVGRVDSFDAASDSARLDADGPVEVSTHGNEQLEIGKIYEIIGKVGVSDHKINSYSVMRLSDNVNLDYTNKLAKMVEKVPELFF